MLKPAAIFADQMILQRNKPITIWGKADIGADVTVRLDEAEAVCQTDHDGNWTVSLPPQDAAQDLTMTICSGEEALTLRSVCVGEVWIAGGQSNMAFYLGYEEYFEEVLRSPKNPLIRFYECPRISYEGQDTDFDFSREGFWRSCTDKDLRYFSAVGYYFAAALAEDLQIPIGIIGCNYGGTPACAWMDPEQLRGTEGEVWLTDYADSTRNMDMAAFMEEYRKNPINDSCRMIDDPMNIRIMKDGLSRETQLAVLADPKAVFEAPPIFYERRPGGLYQTMLRKIVPYSVRGVIWYQGETDGDSHPEAYRTVFARMIENWRDLWQDQLPFLFVQLAPFCEWLEVTGKDYGIVRQCQDAVSHTCPDTWMTTTGDVGMEWDIHPKNKKPVGERLALLARGHVYGEDVLCDPPEAYLARRVPEGVEISFRHGEGLMVDGPVLKALQLVLTDGTAVSAAEGHTEAGKLIIREDRPVSAVRFAMTDYCEVNLYNGAGVPARPFDLPVA